MNARKTDVGHSNTIDDWDISAEPQTKHFKYSYATLESINDDCLRTIFYYLNNFEIVKLASTCTRLQDFSNTFIFPKMAKQVKIKMAASKYNSSYVYDEEEVVEEELTMYDLRTPFESFGCFIEQLTLEGSYELNSDDLMKLEPHETESLRFFEDLLDLCPNLHTLRMERVNFSYKDDEILKHVTSSLKELKLLRCSGIETEYSGWSEALKRFTNLTQLSLTGSNDVTVGLFKDNINISTLNIDHESLSTSNDLENILNLIGQNVQQLKLAGFAISPVDDEVYYSIGTLIVDKLPKLEKLSIELSISVELIQSLTQIPHLKFLKVSCGDGSVNSLLRELSYCGKIEELVIENGVFDKDDNAPPLVFDKLLKLRWYEIQSHTKDDWLAVLQVLKRAQMPAINCFNFSLALKEHTAGILALFESKKTLQSMTINCTHSNIADQLAFVHGIIEILKLNPNRPFLKLNIYPLKIKVEQVSDNNR